MTNNLPLFSTLPLVLVFVLSTACSSAPVSPKIEAFSAKHCEVLYQVKTELQVDDSLKLVSDLFESGCYQEVISLGSFLRERSRDKYYYTAAHKFGDIVAI